MRTVNDFPDIDPSDLVDSGNTHQPARFSKWALGVACAIGIPLAAVALILGSLPEMSPAEIVQMEGYAGRQQAETAQLVRARTQSPLQEVEIGGFEATKADAEQAPVGAVAQDDSFREIAAATQATEKDRVVANSGALDGDNYPVLQVKKQYSNLRAGPSTSEEILTSLLVGSTVTVFDRRGDWLQVEVIDDPAVTGYMHKSLLGIVSPGAN